MTFSTLFVCTGNICRSPAAELIFAARVRGLPMDVRSAGTSGLSGHDMDAPSALAVREFGLDPSAHVARRLTSAMTVDADLILTADSAQRSVVVQAQPLLFRRAFTMREFGRLGADLGPLDDDPGPDSLRERVALVAAQRGFLEPGAAGSDEIGDPLGAGVDVARRTVATISDAVDGVLRALGLPQRPGPAGPFALS